MSPDRFYVTEIHEGPKSRQFYFYASVEGLTGPEYGYSEDDSWVEQAYASAIHGVRERLLLQPWGWVAEARVVVSGSGPREISSDESVRLAPEVNVYIVNAIGLAKREIKDALHPIRITWHWQTSEEVRDDAAVYLKLSDDTGMFGEGFTLQQVKDESLMKNRIRHLYQDLLGHRSRTLIMDLLRGKVGAAKD
jgi:hypothetical protein